jgi:hypothetical protein
MKTTTLAIATIAIICAAGPMAASVASPPVAQDTATMWNGKWQGTTVSGHPLVLQIQVEGQRMKGRLTVGKQSANIIEGKVSGQGFALVTGPIDGYKVSGMGRHLGDAIEFSIDGVKQPLTLTRTKE